MTLGYRGINDSVLAQKHPQILSRCLWLRDDSQIHAGGRDITD